MAVTEEDIARGWQLCEVMSFPFGTNEYSSLWAFSWCEGGHCCCPRYDDDDPYEPQEDDGPYAAGASVSFSESVVIFEDSYEVTEIAMVSTNAIGYFAQPEHADDLDHGKRGAYGQWSPINADNSTTDMARMGYCAKPWNGGGSYTWPIPNAWRVVGDGVSTNVFTQTDQRFELDADGTTRLTKFGWGGERGTNCQCRVYEVSGR